VRALLLGDAGVRVYATSRTAERLEVLLGRLPADAVSRVAPIVADAGDFAGAARLAEEVTARGGVDGVVAVLGRGWWSSGPTLDLAPSEWSAVLDEMLTAHFALARAFVPLLKARAGSTYLSIGGGAAFVPVREAGLMSVAAAGQAMLTRVLAREAGEGAPRIAELVINGPVATRESAHFAEPGWITADDVGLVVSELILRGATTWQPSRIDGPLIVMSERA
jgi:NAD(P)-dependent dehydrogenase (short-subunit alcohol dehydrogenase family)